MGIRHAKWRGRSVVTAAVLLAGMSAAPVAQGAGGDLSQKPPPIGCVGPAFGACTAAGPILGGHDVLVGPDGENVYLTSSGSDSLTTFDRESNGGLTQKDGGEGCINNGVSGDCEVGVGLNGANGIAISPDGASVYVAAFTGDSIAVFDRDPATGVLEQKTGLDACVSEDGTGGACENGIAMDGVADLAVSPDGRHVYAVASASSAVTIFDRDTSGTATHGALSQKTGSAACTSEAPVAGASCVDAKALVGPTAVVMSADGANLYVTSASSDAIAVLDRDPATGEIAQKPGQLGCISESGTGGACQDGTEIGNADIALSPDQGSIYTAAINDAIAILDRSTTTGRLTQKPGAAGCISETGTGALCQDGFLLDAADGLTVSPDGTSVYVASQLSDAVTRFARSANGGLIQRTGAGACVSETGSGGLCTDGVALDAVTAAAVDPQGTAVFAPGVGGTVAILDIEPAAAPEPPAPQAPAAADTAAPDTAITAGPKKKELKKKATFEFTSTEPGSTFQCKLDDGGFEACTSPEEVKAGKGKHTFEVRARDGAGNVDPTPAVRKWTVKKKKKKPA